MIKKIITINKKENIIRDQPEEEIVPELLWITSISVCIR